MSSIGVASRIEERPAGRSAALIRARSPDRVGLVRRASCGFRTVKWLLEDNDMDYDYDPRLDRHPVGNYERVLVPEKTIGKPGRKLEP